MRVALFSNTIDVTNGYGNITYEFCRHLKQRGDIDFTLFLPGAERTHAEKQSRAVVEQGGIDFDVQTVLPKYIFRFYQDPLLNIFRSIDVSGFDLVHSLYAFPYCITALRSANRYGKPFMMGEQGTYGVVPLLFFPERHLLKWCYKNAKKIVVPSQFTRDKINSAAREQYDIDIIHNGVNFERFSKPVDHSAVDAKYTGKKILLTVGGLKDRKGHDLVLRALAQLKDRHNDLMYVVVGEGFLKDQLKALAKELSVDHIVDFVGGKRSDELVAYFQRCDVYVHTPKLVNENFEGFGIVYLEAGAAGKPSIATDSGGVRDAVVDGKTGLICPDGDIDAIASAIDKLLTDTALAQKLGAAGKEYAKQHDWQAIVSKFVDMYRQVQ